MHSLTIHVDNPESLQDNQKREHSFSDRTSIGRGGTMDLVLFDSENIVSKHHCDIYREDQGYLVVDYSSNGTLLNDAPLSHSVPSALKDGDNLIVGDFNLSIAIQEQAESKPAEDIAQAKVPRPVEATIPAQPEPSTAPLAQIQSPEATRPNEDTPLAQQLSEPQRPELHQPQTKQPERQSEPQAELETESTNTSKVADMPKDNSHTRSKESAHSLPPLGEVAERDAYRAFVKAAGISDKALDGQDPVKTMELAGKIIRTTVYGIRQTLMYRTKVKKYLESNITTLLPEDNNPLKYTVSEDHAIDTIFSDQIKGFLAPDDAFREIFNDIIQVMANTVEDSSSKNDRLVEVLNPGTYEKRIKDHPHGSIPYYKYKVMWRLFSEDFENLNRNDRNGRV